MTLHRLLGWRPDNATRFRHDRSNRLKYDVVVVDESSMVELTMMGRLLEAVRPQARLVLVGDPAQLTSVGAGAVLSDLVAGLRRRPGLAGRAAHRELPLHRGHQGARRGAPRRRRRRRARRAADAVRPGRVRRDRRGRAEAALRADCVAAALARARGCARPRTPQAAVAALDEHRLLCAHREGPHGVRHWNRQVERWLAERPGVDALRRVVRRPPAAGHQQRLRARRLQRRDRRRGPPGPAAAARSSPGSERAQGSSHPAASTRSRPCTR